MRSYLLWLVTVIFVCSIGHAGDIDWKHLLAETAISLPQLVLRAGIKIPIHGHFCGPNHGDQSLEPTDGLDAACKRHDACYQMRPEGLENDCACDAQLLDEVEEFLAVETSGFKHAHLAGIATFMYFSLSSCYCTKDDGSVALLKRATRKKKASCV